jgi:tetratricopeptide (TPR) repeat protein
MYHLGTAFFHRRLYHEARNLFVSVLKMDHDYHQAQLYLGLTELELGNTDKAISCCKVAIAQKPGYADYYNSLGECYLLANNCTEAINEFTKAIEVNLYYSDAYLNLGLALVLNGIISQDRSLFANILSKATDHFRKAAIIDSSYQGSAFDSGLSALAAADLQKAWDIFSELRLNRKEGRRRETAAYFMKSLAFVDQASLETITDRINFLKIELSKNPTFVDRQVELARNYLELARLAWQSGIEQYRCTHEMNRSLTSLPRNLETAGQLYESLVAALDRIDRDAGK